METSLNARLRPAELVQSLALLANVVPNEMRMTVAHGLMGESDWVKITLSQSLYKYEALIAVGGSSGASVISMVDKEWSKMLGQGATSFWEVSEGWPAFGGAGSLCHGWSAIPIYIYGAHPELLRGDN